MDRESCLETKQGPTHKWPPLNAYLLSGFRLNTGMIQLLSIKQLDFP